MIDYLHSAAPAAGTDKVRVPGEPERESRERRIHSGIPIDGGSWKAINDAARAAGLGEDEIAAVPLTR